MPYWFIFFSYSTFPLQIQNPRQGRGTAHRNQTEFHAICASLTSVSLALQLLQSLPAVLHHTRPVPLNPVGLFMGVNANKN